MSDCMTEVQFRSIKVGSSSGARNKLASEKPGGRALFKMKANEKTKGEAKRIRPFLIHATRFVRRSLSASSYLFIWLSVADFLFQFAHVHNDGRSLAGIVHTLVSSIQTPLERLIGFDARYQFPVSTVDFMPLILFVVFLILRNRVDAWLSKAERRIRGEKEKPLPAYRSHSTDTSTSGSNTPLQRGRRSGGDDHLRLQDKVRAIYSD